jgi:hypothetical protein
MNVCVKSVLILVMMHTVVVPHGLQERIVVDVTHLNCVVFVGLTWEPVPGLASMISSQRMVLTLMKLH